MPQSVQVVKSSAELGGLARQYRKSKVKKSLSVLAQEAGVGMRFLSEFERGKESAALGKVLDSLHAMGLDLAVVPEDASVDAGQGYSSLLETEFPYDWSNREMSADLFMRKVLERHRFNDVMRIVKYFGFGRVSALMTEFDDEKLVRKLAGILGRIQTGKLLANKGMADVA